jgi:hypothetical protein
MLGSMPGSPPDAKGVHRLGLSPAMEGEQAQLIVAIAAGSDPIAGRLTLPDGSSTSFEGYMELIAALERLRGAPLGGATGEASPRS